MRDEDDRFIRQVAEALRAPVRVSPELDERVMAAVRGAAPADRRRRRLDWLTRPRTLRLSPLAGLALAAGLAGLAVLGARKAAGPVAAGHPAPAREAALPAPAGSVRLAARGRLHPTRFVLAAPRARSVALVGAFNGWDPASTPLVRGADGRWETSLPLGAGRYEYAFIVDGTRVVTDPAAPAAPGGDFGAPNSVVVVGGGVP